MLTVACVNVGNYLGMGRKYVLTLKSMCKRHLPKHVFKVITKSDKPGFWAKIDLFEPRRFAGEVLYLDLDIVIRSDLTPLIEYLRTTPGEFWALDDFAWPLQVPRSDYPAWARDKVYRLIGGPGTCNSSVMYWRQEAGRDIWEQYTPEAAEGLAGDQNWITKVMGRRLRLIPRGWAGSYKYGPANQPITVFHGDPKPHQVPDTWVYENWR